MIFRLNKVNKCSLSSLVFQYGRFRCKQLHSDNGLTLEVKSYQAKIMAALVLSRKYIGKDIENRLLQAAERGDVSTVSKILKIKIDPNVRDGDGATAVTKAAAEKNVRVSMWCVVDYVLLGPDDNI
ncbi:hypothetical protein KUTeg_021853 [Tegillarca granosa]|uniref:Uncharacterized protein n=1 Tax=Tegillarca granosa TaxID=220873 RepID=A0ABQ9E4J5_TEGGR|nr:hypothetical protein KUTeg_021853 [Tegillarca granosa]